MTSPKIFIATPTYDGRVEALYTASLYEASKFAQSQGIATIYQQVLCRLVHHARDILAHKFLQSDCTHLFFIDADVAFTPIDFMRLVRADRDIVGGFYPMKGRDRRDNVIRAYVNLSDMQEPVPGDGLVRANAVSGGFTIIKREVIEALVKTTRLPSHEVPSIFWYLYGGRHVGEDNYLCHTARDLGYECWLDTQVQLVHIGQYEYNDRHALKSGVRPIDMIR